MKAQRPDRIAAALGLAVAVTATGGVASWARAQESAPPAADAVEADTPASAEDEHAALFLENRFPAATTCATCHPDHYREWSVSPHAYAQMSPVFNAMHGTIVKLTNGTNGDFCIRCHTPVGMNLGEPEFMSNIDRHPTSREGVTCVVCHRVDRAYGKLSGRLAIVEGDIFDPVYGPTGGAELERVIASDEYRVNTERGRAGRAIHTEAERFFPLTTSGLCATCHDVNLVNGFRLEEAFSEFKTSPAAAEGTSCQDCHMGTEPGVPSGYAEAPAAVVGGRPTRPRKRTDHMFIGPDYSVVHPGIFPHNTEAAELATIREWLSFDLEAGWGTDAFEAQPPEGVEFPDRWRTADDRYDARDVLDDNLALLAEAHAKRLTVLRNGYRIGEVVVERDGREDGGRGGLAFRVEVENATKGHGVPTGFDAERLVWLHVAVTDRDGRVVFESGDLDPNGDVRDLHSLQVRDGELPLDRQLFSLQSKFVTRMVRGGEREQVLAINYSPDPLPFLRPSTSSTVLTGRPLGARKHKQNIEPLGERWAHYEVPPEALTGAGPYTATIELKAGMVPVNLVHEIAGVGFDYGLSAREVAERVVEGHQVLWEKEVELGGGAARETAGHPGGEHRNGAEHAERHAAEHAAYRAGEPSAPPAEEHPGEPGGHDRAPAHGSGLAAEAVPLVPANVPERPRPLLELGEPFLGSGTLDPGITLPTGAVWQPSLLLYGTLRTGVQSFEDDRGRIAEWASRLDLFANLQLSGTERLIVGFRPLDRDGRFTSYVFDSDVPGVAGNDFQDELNGEITSLFFEGDFGEIFPELSREDFRRTDLGFSVGRQPLLFQEGLLIDDSIDGLGLTRNTLQPSGTSNVRATLFWGWNEVGRSVLGGGNPEDGDAQMLALLTSTDTRRSTIDADLVWVRSGVRPTAAPGAGGPLFVGGDLVAGGVSFVQRIGKASTALRVLGSVAIDDTLATGDGALVFGELSWTPPHSHDHVYVNGFWALDRYVSAARGPSAGGPLGRAGINFAAVGLGRYGAALSSEARDVAGGAVGYQRFFDSTRRQVIVELGARAGTGEAVADAIAATARWQAALGRRFVLVVDGFAGLRESLLPGVDDEELFGGRVELVLKF